MTNAQIGPVIDAIYDSAVAPGQWPALLNRLAVLFRSHFADVFARTLDRAQFSGIAVGLDRTDYEQDFLGTWARRNVWGVRRPVRLAGEIVTTRQMVPKPELLRSEMYNEYLAPRDLHEGLRLAIWSGQGWIQDISLLRPWSAGPFGGTEIALAATLLPHLQRAAAVARRLREAEALSASGLAMFDALRHAAFLLDRTGRVMLHNAAAARLLAARDGLGLEASGLTAASPSATTRLRAVLVAAAGASGTRLSGALRLPRPSGRPALALIAMPLRAEADWSLLHPPAVLALVSDPAAATTHEAAPLQDLFGLSPAEATLAHELLAGRTVNEIAARSARSVHTVRTLLARLMAKTETSRQSELVRLLMATAGTGITVRPEP